jgi:DNA-binding CsgD family transcriptional regulator
LIALVWKDAGTEGEGAAKAAAKWAEALLCNGLGRYAGALKAGFEAAEHPLGLGPSYWGLVEMIEGAVRAGDRPAAVAGSRRLSDMAAASGTGWALGVAARSSALLAEGPRARGLFLEAMDHLGGAGVRVEVARARLLYGEWLRREGRRREARDQLRVAYDVLSAAGVDAFAYRARRELAATGEHVRRRTADARQELTAQELNIARLAAVGLSNPDIGAELFISPRTVEWHMGKVLAKLGITARRQLGEALQADFSGHQDGMPRPPTGNVLLSDATAAERRGSLARRFG